MADRPADRRRRLAKACDYCRSKKLRCDGIRPSCSRCQSKQGEAACHYADVIKPRRRGQHPPAAGVSGREPCATTTDGATAAAAAAAGTTAVEATFKPASGWQRPSPESRPRTQHQLHQGKLSGTLVGGINDTRFFGSLAAISLVSLDEAPNPASSDVFPTAPTTGSPSATGYRNNSNKSHRGGSWTSWTHATIESMLTRRPSQPLPSWAEAFSLVKEYFDNEHKAFPCFHPPTFMALLGRQYGGGGGCEGSLASIDNSAAWLTSLNAVLAIAQRARSEKARHQRSSSSTSSIVDSANDNEEQEQLAWGYAANALGTALDVMMRNTQLISVQALLSIAWFLLGTPNPQPAFMFTGSAVRLAHAIGLHSDSRVDAQGGRDKTMCTTPIERQMRSKVFWLAVSLDHELCLRTGRPTAHDLQTFRVELPGNPRAPSVGGREECYHDDADAESLTTAAGLKIPLVRAHAQLALVQHCIYRELNVVDHGRDGEDEAKTAISAAQLNAQLEGWAADYITSAVDSTNAAGQHGLVRLYHCYYNCVMVVNRAHGRRYWLPRSGSTLRRLAASMRTCVERCLAAARSVLGLMNALPRTHRSFYWDVIPIQSTAVILVCHHLIREDQDYFSSSSSATKHDLEAVSNVLSLWTFLCSIEKGETYLSNVLGICRDLHRLASKRWQDHIQTHHQPEIRTPVGISGEQGQCDTYKTGTLPFEQSQVPAQAESQPSYRLDPSDWSQSEPLSERAAQMQWNLDFLDMSNPFSSFYPNLI